jgi:hypothetical protein
MVGNQAGNAWDVLGLSSGPRVRREPRVNPKTGEIEYTEVVEEIEQLPDMNVTADRYDSASAYAMSREILNMLSERNQSFNGQSSFYSQTEGAPNVRLDVGRSVVQPNISTTIKVKSGRVLKGKSAWYSVLRKRHGDLRKYDIKRGLQRMISMYISIRNTYGSFARTLPKNSTHRQMNLAAAMTLSASRDPLVAAAGRGQMQSYNTNNPAGLGGYSSPSGSEVNIPRRHPDPKTDIYMYLEAEGNKDHEAAHDSQYERLLQEANGSQEEFERTTTGEGSGPLFAGFESEAYDENIEFLSDVMETLYPESE